MYGAKFCTQTCTEPVHGLGLISIGIITGKKIVLFKHRFGLCSLPQQHEWRVACSRW